MRWSIRAHPGWKKRELRTPGDECENEDTCESRSESGTGSYFS